MNVVRPEDGATEIKRAKARLLNAASEHFTSSGNESNALASSLAAQNCSFMYWESTEAKNLFRPLNDETMQKAIVNHIEALTEVHQQYNGYLDIIENIEEIDETELSDYQIWSI